MPEMGAGVHKKFLIIAQELKSAALFGKRGDYERRIRQCPNRESSNGQTKPKFALPSSFRGKYGRRILPRGSHCSAKARTRSLQPMQYSRRTWRQGLKENTATASASGESLICSACTVSRSLF